MHSSFANAANNHFDRNFGGTDKGVADGYVTGYQFIYFYQLPQLLSTYTRYNGDVQNIGSNGDIQKLLSGSCLAVTPPGGTLNKTEYTGLGGTKWSIPTNIDYGNTLTAKFLEFSGTPILHIFHSWFRMIREYRTGTSPLGGAVNGGYTKSNYSGTMFYWTTKPDGQTVEYAACYTGMFPTKDPQDLFAGDVTAVDKLEIDMEFSLDYVWREKWVTDWCRSKALEFRALAAGSFGHGTLDAVGGNSPGGFEASGAINTG